MVKYIEMFEKVYESSLDQELLTVLGEVETYLY